MDTLAAFALQQLAPTLTLVLERTLTYLQTHTHTKSRDSRGWDRVVAFVARKNADDFFSSVKPVGAW